MLYMWAAPNKAQYLACYLKTLTLKQGTGNIGKHRMALHKDGLNAGI